MDKAKELIEKCRLTDEGLKTAYKTWKDEEFTEFWDIRFQNKVLAKAIPIIRADERGRNLERTHLIISHIWQFARGTGYPLKWEIGDAEFKSVLKHYGIKWGQEGQAKEGE